MSSLIFRTNGQDVCCRRVPGCPDVRVWQFYCPINALNAEQFSKWLCVNPRSATSGSVHKGIVNTLVGTKDEEYRPHSMVLKNAGWIVSAESAKKNGSGDVEVVLSKQKLHGLIDGNNTRTAIMEALAVFDAMPDGEGVDPSEICIEVNVYTGLDRDQVIDLAEGQNIRKPVQFQSLLNFTGFFTDIKESLGARAKEIAWCEGDDGEMDVRYLLQILESVNTVRYPNARKSPMVYAHPGTCLKRWRDGYMVANPQKDPSMSMILAEHAAEILEAYDKVEARLPELWNKAGGRWGAAIKQNNATKAIALVAFQAMRPVVKMDMDTRTFKFLVDVDKVLDVCGVDIVNHIKDEFQRKGKAADNVGKTPALYTSTYNEVLASGLVP